ncbi:MAG: Crp/Fnr family transcriptional regulator [Anaerolineaceae bacterium]|nr:Crp/Fnr family transcriptional regulator [Anaerolineaceae bacterium]
MVLSKNEIEAAHKASLLRGLNPLELDEVIQAAHIQRLSDGAFFFMEDEAATETFVLVMGKVKLVQVTPDGQQIILGYLVPGRTFGVIASLKKMTYPVSAQAVGVCAALAWDQKTINTLMDSFPRIALNTLHIMAGQIREFQNTVRDLSTQRVEQRVARAILRLARHSGREIKEGVLIDLPLSRQDLAEMTATTLYTVSRILKEWENRGIVESKRQRVLILYPHGLVQIAEDLPAVNKQHIETIRKCDLGE